MPSSTGLNAEAATRSRTSPAPGAGISTSSWRRTSGSPYSWKRTAFIGGLNSRSVVGVCFEFEASVEYGSTTSNSKQVNLQAVPGAPPSLDPAQLGAYFALIEVSSLLRHGVEQQLRDAGDLSYVQFQLLARLGDSPTGSHRMTDLADGVVYSRSGLTYQVGLLEKRGLVTRASSPDDERVVTVTITDAGRALLAKVFPGHIDVLKQLLFEPLSRKDAKALADLLAPVRDHMRSTPPRSAAPRRRRT